MSNYPAGVSGQTIDDYFGDDIEDILSPREMNELLDLETDLENAYSRLDRLDRIMYKFGDRADVLADRYLKLDSEIIPELKQEISGYYDRAGMESPF